MTPPEHTIVVDRDSDAPLIFGFKGGVRATEAIDLEGSSFELRLFDTRGGLLLSVAGEIGDLSRVSFALSDAQRADLPPGTGRFSVLRSIADETRPWVRGAVRIIGGS